MNALLDDVAFAFAVALLTVLAVAEVCCRMALVLILFPFVLMDPQLAVSLVGRCLFAEDIGKMSRARRR